MMNEQRRPARNAATEDHPSRKSIGRDGRPAPRRGCGGVSRLDRIPAELRRLPRWVVWRWESDPEKPEKPKKPPYRIDLQAHASSTKPETWGSFEQAAAVVEAGKADGIGFALEPPYVGIDLDAELLPAEQELIFLALNSYTELSPWRHVNLVEGTLRVEESKSEEGSVSSRSLESSSTSSRHTSRARPTAPTTISCSVTRSEAPSSRRTGTTTSSRRRSRRPASRGAFGRSTTCATRR
jgi:hypothetical protein